MKKVITFFALLMLLSTLYITAYAYKGYIPIDNKMINYNAPDVTITVDGKPFNTSTNPPLILDGNTIVPARSIAEGLGAKVDWDIATQTVTITKDKVFKFFIGRDYAIVDGNKVSLPAPARIVNWGVSYVPMRFLFENLGYDVKWIGDKYLIQATKKAVSSLPTVNNINITDFTSTFSNGVYTITVKADGPISYKQGTVNDDTSVRVYFDFSNAINASASKQISINKNGLNLAYIGQNQLEPTAITRLVVNMDYQMPFSITQSQDKKEFNISFKIGKNTVTNISATKVDNGDQLVIRTDANHFNPLRNGDNKIIIDIPETSLNMPDGKLAGSIPFSGNIITDIRYSQLDENTVRVVADTNIKADFNVQLMGQGIVMVVIKPDPNKKQLVYIDPGHGGSDPGAIGVGGIREADINLAIGLKLKTLLEKGGYRTMISRESDVDVGLYDRPYQANNAGADVFVSIHSDSFDSPSANGTTILYFPNGDRGDTRDNRTFAQIIHDNLMKQISTTDRGLSERPNLVVLNQTKMPAVLVETGFVTNPSDAKLLQDDNFQWKVAQGIYNGIVEYFDKVKNGSVQTTVSGSVYMNN
ncbi:N-acetylmuramoyl-L-alanine amidase family protein [Thermoanaerobacterium sp. RBIITD]|uniref:N-acetylmuramoyl-L-alanine amidase family protein n=1 Tax=Thermoanaerobacterium sp. RBIITD TaxID=1550240 RepID=UPI000BBF837C|nr:N-acetylmuramoyl-L-alanine amidase family protein [Thermoanaerobacterium sp. RBIITD]SNX52999.1 N-acetylmuramoyl-L-alanine amidase [Thermoanaerobacterium sp. RBIITD]